MRGVRFLARLSVLVLLATAACAAAPSHAAASRKQEAKPKPTARGASTLPATAPTVLRQTATGVAGGTAQVANQPLVLNGPAPLVRRPAPPTAPVKKPAPVPVQRPKSQTRNSAAITGTAVKAPIFPATAASQSPDARGAAPIVRKDPAVATAPRRSTPLPPGPLSSAPVNLSVTPSEMRVTGLGTSSAPWAVVLLLTALTLLPSLLICMTPFARLLVVFHFLRQALGLQTTPSNQTLIGLTLILTFFIMQPVGRQVYVAAVEPLQHGEITSFEAISRSEGPLREFMVHYVREKDAALFLEIAHEPRPHDVRDLSMRVLLPAYIVSELKAGFQIGAVLFLPFLVVDMVVASITNSVGMMQLPPVVISTPLKLLLFLMVDGWHLLIGALMRSFQ